MASWGDGHARADTRRTIRARRRRENWQTTTLVMIVVGVLAALWQAFNGTGWAQPR